MRGSAAQEPIGFILTKPAGSGRWEKTPPSFISSLVTIAGGQLGCTAVAALAELSFARLLGPASRGLVSLCLMSIAFGALIGSLGSEATVVVWISRFRGKHAAWFPAVALWVFSGCLVAVCVWAGLYWQWHPTFLKGLTPELALLVLVTIPATVSFSMLMALLVGEERFRLRSVIALLNRISSLGAFFLCVLLFGRRPETAILGNLIGLVAGVCVACVFLRHFFRGAWRIVQARENLFSTMMFGIRGQAGNLASFFSYRLDVFVVNYYLDASQVGLYALGVLVSEALWQLPGVVSVALFPRTARTVGAGADSFTCTVLRQVFLVTLVAGFLVAACSPIAIPLLFGARYALSVPVIWWILPGTIALSLAKVIAADLTGRGLNIHLPISASLGFALTILLDLLLIPRMGIQGAALASSVAYLAAAGYLFIVIQRELKTPWGTLFLPTAAEWLVYQRLWLAYRMRFWRKKPIGSPTQ
jgi:O-antigen/teichoic acid export membrane protein